MFHFGGDGYGMAAGWLDASTRRCGRIVERIAVFCCAARDGAWFDGMEGASR